jgi:Mrp family chromosome partitioning ATPase
MANKMNIPIVGIVENMSYFECPDCKKKHYIYGESHIDEIANNLNINKVAKLPIKPEVAALIDSGKAEEIDVTALDGIFEAIKQA